MRKRVYVVQGKDHLGYPDLRCFSTRYEAEDEAKYEQRLGGKVRVTVYVPAHSEGSDNG